MMKVIAAIVLFSIAVIAPASAQQFAAVLSISSPQSAAAELDAALRAPNQRPMVVYFHAPDCPPCGQVAPIVAAFGSQWRHTLRSVDVGGFYPPMDKTRAWGAAIRAKGLPSRVPLAILVVNGVVVAHHAGAQGLEAQLRAWSAAYR